MKFRLSGLAHPTVQARERAHVEALRKALAPYPERLARYEAKLKESR
jgi:hypothetical protein